MWWNENKFGSVEKPGLKKWWSDHLGEFISKLDHMFCIWSIGVVFHAEKYEFFYSVAPNSTLMYYNFIFLLYVT